MKKVKLFIFSILIGILYIMGPLAIIINCFIFTDLIALLICLIVVLVGIFILIVNFYYQRLCNRYLE